MNVGGGHCGPRRRRPATLAACASQVHRHDVPCQLWEQLHAHVLSVPARAGPSFRPIPLPIPSLAAGRSLVKGRAPRIMRAQSPIRP